jgi:hypothetical protein
METNPLESWNLINVPSTGEPSRRSRILVQQIHVALLTANGIAIGCCSIANFCLGNLWAFPSSAEE